jgi:hypothetical protein
MLPTLGNMEPAMDIAELARRTGLPTRRLRYALDHRVMPVGRVEEGRGIPRSFTAFEAFALACAALLLESGLKRRLVQACLHATAGRFTRATQIREIPLYQAYSARSAWLEVGDGVCLRLHGKGQPGVGKDFDTGWQLLRKELAGPVKFSPLVLLQIDLTGLKQRVGR